MKGIKSVISIIFGFFTSLFGVLAVPILLLVCSNIVDYITGLMAAPYRGEKISSYKSFKGIAKKVCQWLLVAVGSIMDHIILYTSEQFGWRFEINFLIAAIVAIWLIVNECLSILENIATIDSSKVPKFLTNILELIKTTTEAQIPTTDKKDKNNGSGKNSN